jgi:hypothetical protein
VERPRRDQATVRVVWRRNEARDVATVRPHPGDLHAHLPLLLHANCSLLP